MIIDSTRLLESIIYKSQVQVGYYKNNCFKKNYEKRFYCIIRLEVGPPLFQFSAFLSFCSQVSVFSGLRFL